MSAIDTRLLIEASKLNPSALIELYELDATSLGGGVLRFHNGVTNEHKTIRFGGQVYSPFPVEVKGFDLKGKGELPRPIVKFANVAGFMTGISLLYNDLVGAKFTRKRTYSRFLEGQVEAGAVIGYPEDIFYIERKTNENKFVLEFELGCLLDIEGIMLPRRQFLANTCYWKYRSSECEFALDKVVADSRNVRLGGGSQVFRGAWSGSTLYFRYDVVYVVIRGIKTYFILNVAQAVGDAYSPPNTAYWKTDACAKRLSSCKMRHDPLNRNLPLPFGAFVGSEQIPNV